MEEKRNGLTEICIVNQKDDISYYLDFGEESYSAYTTTNVEFDTDVLRYGYSSMTTPSSTLEWNMNSQEKTVLKETEILGSFKKEDYESKRIWATAKDGVKVPISLVYKKGLTLDENTPLLQYAYGSYGHSIDAYFSVARLSLLDRGFVYAIAHIRGGEELGRGWYEDGKLYDNVERKAYPNMLVTTGLHDSQVQYFEPAKWVAKLRDYKTDDNLLLLYINMDTGHGGASGRFEAFKEVAMEYAFILNLVERK